MQLAIKSTKQMEIKNPHLAEAISEALDVIQNETIDGFKFDLSFGVSPEEFLAKLIWNEITNHLATANSSSPLNGEYCAEVLKECVDDNLPE